MPLLLESSDYFNIEKSTLGKATSMTLIWATVIPLILTPVIAFLYEGIGRRIPVIASMIIIHVTIWLMPQVSPNFTMVCVLRALLSVCNTIGCSAPLISDNIKMESRASAVTLNVLAIGLSQLFGTQVIVPLTQKLSFSELFSATSFMLLILTIPVLLMIREPNLKKLEQPTENLLINENMEEQRLLLNPAESNAPAPSKSTWTTIKDISYNTYKLVRSDPSWIFLFLAGSNAYFISFLYTSYMILWLNSFVDNANAL